jgi:hypothetical protein
VDGSAHSARYEIRVRCVLSERLLGAFPELEPHTLGNETVLAGELPDQAALYGVLAELEALGLELLEVRVRASTRMKHPHRASPW